MNKYALATYHFSSKKITINAYSTDNEYIYIKLQNCPSLKKIQMINFYYLIIGIALLPYGL